jgi:hypothetical protein
MTINVIDAARDKGLSPPPRGGEWTLLLLLAAQVARNLETRARRRP